MDGSVRELEGETLESLGPDLKHETRSSSQHFWEFLQGLSESVLVENGKKC